MLAEMSYILTVNKDKELIGYITKAEWVSPEPLLTALKLKLESLMKYKVCDDYALIIRSPSWVLFCDLDNVDFLRKIEELQSSYERKFTRIYIDDYLDGMTEFDLYTKNISYVPYVDDLEENAYTRAMKDLQNK